MGEHGKKRALPLTTILCALTAGLRFLCDSSDRFNWCMLLPQPTPSPNSASFHEGEMQSHISERKLARGCICSAGSAKLLPFNSYRVRELCGAGGGRAGEQLCVRGWWAEQPRAAPHLLEPVLLQPNAVSSALSRHLSWSDATQYGATEFKYFSSSACIPQEQDVP